MKSSAAILFKMLNSGQHHLFSRILRTSILTWELPQLFFSNHQPVPDRFHPFTGLSKLPNRKAEDPQLLLNQGPPNKKLLGGFSSSHMYFCLFLMIVQIL